MLYHLSYSTVVWDYKGKVFFRLCKYNFQFFCRNGIRERKRHQNVPGTAEIRGAGTKRGQKRARAGEYPKNSLSLKDEANNHASMNPNEFDVIIIGGGITGAGTQRDCTMRGLRTLLVERSDIATGATGRNHGLLHSGPDTP